MGDGFLRVMNNVRATAISTTTTSLLPWKVPIKSLNLNTTIVTTIVIVNVIITLVAISESEGTAIYAGNNYNAYRDYASQLAGLTNGYPEVSLSVP